MLYPNEVVIHDGNAQDFIDHVVDGEVKARGLIPRDYSQFPRGCYASAPAVDFPLIPRNEWVERIADKVAAKSRLSDVRMMGNAGKPIASLDQGQVGYCWAHSSTGGVMIVRAVMGMPYVPLSAYAVAATIKKGADEGGWGAQSLDFIMAKGVPSQALWPQGDRSYKKYDKPEVWADAAKHKVTQGWADLAAAQYDRKLSYDQVITLLLSDCPVVSDYNWWGHSVLALDAVDGNAVAKSGTIRTSAGKLPSLQDLELWLGLADAVTGGVNVRILNSWGDSWSDHGMGVLTGSKAVPDGAVAPLVAVPSDG